MGWGLLLSILRSIYANADAYDPLALKLAGLVTLLGSFGTRRMVLKLKLSALRVG
jgi:hypothetical protein